MSKLVLRDRIRIDALPEDVWPWVEDPERVMAWNPKLKAVEPITQGPRRVGYEYRAVYSLGDRENEMSARYEEYQAPVHLAIRMHGGRLPPEGFCREEYELTARGRTTRLCQKITLVDPGIPLVLRLLIKLVHVFGKPSGKSNLQVLRELVEGDPPTRRT
jgi:hypothetical protein